MAGVNINAYVTFIVSDLNSSNSPTIRRHSITSLLGIYSISEAHRRCHDALFVNTTSSGLATTTATRSRAQPSCTRKSNGWQSTYIHVHTHALCCTSPGRALQSPNEQVHAVQRTPSWRPMPKSPHAYAVTCLREGGGRSRRSTLTAQGVTSERRIQPCDTRWCDRMIFCWSVR